MKKRVKTVAKGCATLAYTVGNQNNKMIGKIKNS